ncbi:hypothetical protein PHMEG_00015613 [Phytophthora megakarya]|uniref:Uncharacterized protein n=1 Tax=Phytophthora megakarya TaxID=4795 RepID=A0A225UNN3_9STRA|nr:hypothetical protein PHMEG_00035477 [Phytophthora megakarya]OWZ11375.1 hypothetical protein PHMEG_00015613 [Phytophthora megakarya]
MGRRGGGVVIVSDNGNVWEFIGIVIACIVALGCLLGCCAALCGKSKKEKAAEAAAAQAELEATQAAQMYCAPGGFVVMEAAPPVLSATPYTIVKDTRETA